MSSGGSGKFRLSKGTEFGSLRVHRDDNLDEMFRVSFEHGGFCKVHVFTPDGYGEVQRVFFFSLEGFLEEELWMLNGHAHRADGPARVGFFPGGGVKSETWVQNGETHRVGGPAQLNYSEDGVLWREVWYWEGKPHREWETHRRVGGPAVTVRFAETGVVAAEEYYTHGVRFESSVDSPGMG